MRFGKSEDREEMDPEDEGEGEDSLAELPASFCPPEVAEEVMRAKRADPTKFASWWEMDEEDIDEATEEQIQNDPVQRTLWAAENDHLDVLREMISSNADLVHAKDGDGYSPLHRAAYGNHTEAMLILLDAGADVAARTNDEWTPLHSACRWDQTEAADILVCHGADVNAQTAGGQTPLHLAAANTNTTSRTLQLLLSNRYINIKVKNKMGETALTLCSRNNPYCGLFEMREDHVTDLIPR